MKPELTFEQRIAAAYAHYCHCVPQDVIASILLVNMGRVNEACLAIKQAAERGKKIDDAVSINATYVPRGNVNA